MIPMSRIKIRDIFRNPRTKDNVRYAVIDIDLKEKCILLQGFSSSYIYTTGSPVASPFWKKNTDAIFSEEGRI